MTLLFNLLLRRHGDRMETPALRRGNSALTDAMLGYIHSHYGIASLEDFRNGVKLAVEIIKRLDKDTISAF